MTVDRSKVTYLGVCVAIAATSLILGRKDLGAFSRPVKRPVETTLQPIFLPTAQPLAQSYKRRVFKDMHLQPVGSFKVTLNAPPTRVVHSSSNETILVLDLNESTVKEYAESGALVRKYSSGDEDVPAQIIDFTIGSDGTVWTADPNGDVVGIGLDGRTNYHLKGLHAYRLAWLKDRLVVETMPSKALPFGDKLFLTVSPSGHVIDRFGELVADNRANGLAVLGQTAAGTDELVLAPMGPGTLASYSVDGTQRYVTQTIDPLPLPQLQVMKSGTTKVALLPPDVTRDIAVSGAFVFLLSHPPPRDEGPTTKVRASIVDVYAIETGKYQYSFEVPLDCDALTIWNNSIYLASRNVLYKWMVGEAF